MAVRMREVAERAGVSPRTVSNVVNGYVYVSPTTRAKVQRALDELGYQMNTAARSLKSGRSGMIALVVPDLHSSYFAELAHAVVRAADRRKLTVLIEVTDGVRERELKVLSGGRTHLTDGTLMSPVALTSDESLPLRPNFPLVLLGESRLGTMLPHVGIDNVAAAKVAVEHLLQQGRRRIVPIGLNNDLPASAPRYEGYLAAHEDRGVAPLPGIRVDSWDRQLGAQAVEVLLQRATHADRMPDAIFAFNDTLALGALRALLQHGVRVPSDIAVASIDDINEAAYATPSLTSIAPDLDALAEEALSLLGKQMAHKSTDQSPRQVWIPFELVVRESTGQG
jgi:LacI family repressor for deo operon, udp, cdd, tsx, nupC, and nupG